MLLDLRYLVKTVVVGAVIGTGKMKFLNHYFMFHLQIVVLLVIVSFAMTVTGMGLAMMEQLAHPSVDEGHAMPISNCDCSWKSNIS